MPLAPVSDEAEAALFVVEADDGPRYWLGLNNFYVDYPLQQKRQLRAGGAGACARVAGGDGTAALNPE